ncbi:hypothetical protein V8E52_005549 [Russula decolorans]
MLKRASQKHSRGQLLVGTSQWISGACGQDKRSKGLEAPCAGLDRRHLEAPTCSINRSALKAASAAKLSVPEWAYCNPSEGHGYPATVQAALGPERPIPYIRTLYGKVLPTSFKATLQLVA